MPYLQQKSSSYVYIVFEHDKFLSLQIKAIIIFDEILATPCRKIASGVDIREDSMYLVRTQKRQCEPTRSA